MEVISGKGVIHLHGQRIVDVLPSLAPGQTEFLGVATAPLFFGKVTNRAIVREATPDPNPGNSVAVAKINVTRRLFGIR
jgi:hypothetical protein